jgi:anthranilate phosphoribosyltransferase
MLQQCIAKLMDNQHLTETEAEAAMGEIMGGEATPAQIGGYLVALRMNGETVGEITGSARAMRAHSARIQGSYSGAVDTAGTGGDGAHTFNISTIAAFVIAGTGRKVAKHGNRAASSQCGSADVLAALGLNLQLTPAQVSQCISQVGIGFLFAPTFHPAMKHAIGPRRELGQRTIFNVLGPLTNPACASRQIMGVYDAGLTRTMAAVSGALGSEATLVFHGFDGIDELTTAGPNRISHLYKGQVRTFDFDPAGPAPAGGAPLPFRRATRDLLRGGDPTTNAKMMLDLLSGRDQSPRRDIVLLNAAAALALDREDLAEHPHRVLGEVLPEAERSLASGAALASLEALLALSGQFQGAYASATV